MVDFEITLDINSAEYTKFCAYLKNFIYEYIDRSYDERKSYKLQQYLNDLQLDINLKNCYLWAIKHIKILINGNTAKFIFDKNYKINGITNYCILRLAENGILGIAGYPILQKCLNYVLQNLNSLYHMFSLGVK